jgi:hypothetical protein
LFIGLLISIFQICIYPILLQYPSANDYIYLYGVIFHNICLSYLSGYIIYVFTSVLPYKKRKRIAINQLNELDKVLVIKMSAFKEPLFSILKKIYNEDFSSDLLTETIINRVLEAFKTNSYELIKTDISSFSNQCKLLMPHMNYVLDQMLSLKEYLPDNVYKEILILRNPSYNCIFTELSIKLDNVPVIINYLQTYFIELDKKINYIHTEIEKIA